MRDIRADLQERLTHVEKELRTIEAKFNNLQSLRETLRVMVAAEAEKWDGLGAQKGLFTNGNGATHEAESHATPLSAILQEVMSDRKKVHLKDIAEAVVKHGYPFGEKKPGRVLHFALLGMKSGGLVERLGEGYWKLNPSP